ncbi:MAG: hypothetical protein K2W92_02705 [Alphaproteobacteria bacterium]|nr:hypothetical protein [Alphaproteobacteria bacterium]
MKIITSSSVEIENDSLTVTLHLDPTINETQTKHYASFKESLEALWSAEELNDKKLVKKYLEEVTRKDNILDAHRRTSFAIFNPELKEIRAYYEKLHGLEVKKTIIYNSF